LRNYFVICKIGLVIEDEFPLGILKDLESKAGKRMMMLLKNSNFFFKKKKKQLPEQVLHVSD
jgi:hypothetical protein